MNACHHRSLSLTTTLLYALTFSTTFVVSLYIFVPPSVRNLPRDDARHIQWRGGVVLVVMFVSVGVYPWLFCRHYVDDTTATTSSNSSSSSYDSCPPWYAYLGISFQPMQDVRVLLHVMVLYLGSMACTWMEMYHCARFFNDGETKKKASDVNENVRINSSGSSFNTKSTHLALLPSPSSILRAIQTVYIQPTMNAYNIFILSPSYRWILLRNLCIAPLAEEVIFRACIVPPLLSSFSGAGELLSPVRVAWIAPSFFGVAHFHHFIRQYSELPPSSSSRDVHRLMLGLILQWSYTTLFGAYASHVLIRTGSLAGVVLVHSLCNYMGLPDVIHGLERITRHPGLWSFGLIGLGNALLVPSLPQRVWLSMPLMVALVGGSHTDSRFRRGMGGTLSNEYDEKTSNVPFLAMLSGKQGNVVDVCRELCWEGKGLNAVLALGVAGVWVARRGRGVVKMPVR
ncbi:predicted protein [Thalassiosira pseudonana CCMP1335]|uniref:intramembrane prenyl-peptidase Rce1 n=1 Tax=Thalassiosira pseudonana TaxID=35128 RepID=B8C7H8_THAPS|nr:predicted protein [Thalassiosira pseudonana CCMP1335]EED90745.1 predicted protein [Thalassiosira pseudonana CCMP1335]